MAYEHEDHDGIRSEQRVRALPGHRAARASIVTKKNRPVAVTVSVQDWDVRQQLLAERGVTQGLEDIDAGRFEPLTEASANPRIARFKARNQAEA